MSHDAFRSIREMSPELEGWGFFLCTYKDVRQGRGEPFISLSLQDKTGLIRGTVLTDAVRLRDEFDSGEFVKIQGQNEHPQRQFAAGRRPNPADQSGSGCGTGVSRGGLCPVGAAAGRRDVERAAGAHPARSGSAYPRAVDAHHHAARRQDSRLAGCPQSASRLSQRISRAHPVGCPLSARCLGPHTVRIRTC